jgi:hypothetical protein
MKGKTIEIILKVVEIIASILISKNKEGGNKNDGTGSSKKK